MSEDNLNLDKNIKSVLLICLSFCYFSYCLKSCTQSDTSQLSYWNGVSQGKKLCKEAE